MTGWTGQTGKIRLNEETMLCRRHSFKSRLRGCVVALAVLLCALTTTTGALAQDNGSAPAAQADTGASSPSSGTSQPRALEVETSSQERSKITVSHEQEAKDRLFVDTTLIAVAVIMSLIAILIFLSMPKAPKKASNANQKEM